MSIDEILCTLLISFCALVVGVGIGAMIEKPHL